jgi:putative membrane protein
VDCTYAGSGDNQTLVGFAKETLPALETHAACVVVLAAGHEKH